MRRPITILATLAISAIGIGAQTASSVNESAGIRDAKVKQVVQSIQEKVAQIKGYTAKVESRSFDPNGGIAEFLDEQSVRCPDRMLVKRKILSMHDPAAVNGTVTIVINGSWEYSRRDPPPLTPERRKQCEKQVMTDYPGEPTLTKEKKLKVLEEILKFSQKPTYSKTNLKAIEQAGGPSLREHIASLGNLADPLAPYKMETLRLDGETKNEWILAAEYKQQDETWPGNRLTIDKKTGFLKKVESLMNLRVETSQLDKPLILLDVKQVTPSSDLPESLFKIDFPVENPTHPDSSSVTDNTDAYLLDIKYNKSMAEEKKGPKLPNK